MGGAWVQRKHRYQESWTEIWSDLCITSLDMNDSKYIYYCSLTIFDHIGFTSVEKHAHIVCSGLHGISSNNLHMKMHVFLQVQTTQRNVGPTTPWAIQLHCHQASNYCRSEWASILSAWEWVRVRALPSLPSRTAHCLFPLPVVLDFLWVEC